MINTAEGGYIMAVVSDSNDGMVNGNHGYFDIWVVKMDAFGIVEWKRCYGGSGAEWDCEVIQSSDGGYIIRSNVSDIIGDGNDGDMSGCYSDEWGHFQDVWVFKIDTFGNLQWQRCIGGNGYDRIYSIMEGADGGVLLCGETDSEDGDVVGLHGSGDIWIVKLDDEGNIVWQRCLGGSGGDYSSVVSPSNDGGYIVLGLTSSSDGDVLGYHDGLDSNYYDGYWDYFYWDDAWIVKLDASGNILWQRCLGGTANDYLRTISSIQDGYLLAGYTSSDDGDVVGYHAGVISDALDAWIVQLNESGNIVWQRCLGGAQSDGVGEVKLMDDGYLFRGSTSSVNGDVTGYHPGMTSSGVRTYDAWIFKTDFAGNMIWQQCLGGTGDEDIQHLEPTESGYFFVGFTNSIDGDVVGFHEPPDSVEVDNFSFGDIWVGNLDLNGELINQVCLGGSYEDGLTGFLDTGDGYLIQGVTESNDGDVTGHYGSLDIWLVQLSNMVGVEETTQANMALFPNPASDRITVITDHDFSNDSYIVYDAQGRAVLQGVLTTLKNEIAVESLSPGIYTLRTVGAGVGSVKFMKE